MSRKAQVDIKARLNLKLDRELKGWVMTYAEEQGTSVSTLIRNYFVRLRHAAEQRNKEPVDQI
jgi:hypothetical protein